jgi:hypothetical protein
MAQADQSMDQNENEDDDEYIDIDTIAQPSTTQLGLQRLEKVPDAYQPGTLPPRLFMSNPFAQQTEPTESGDVSYQMTAKEVPATAKEIQDMEDEAVDEIALSQAIETMVATSRTGRKRTATAKMVDNEEQARQAKTARMSGLGGRGDRGGKV